MRIYRESLPFDWFKLLYYKTAFSMASEISLILVVSVCNDFWLGLLELTSDSNY